MFTIDLLKGTEIPAGPRPMQIAAVTVAFCLLVVGVALDAIRYVEDSNALAAQEQSLKVYTHDLAQLACLGDVGCRYPAGRQDGGHRNGNDGDRIDGRRCRETAGWLTAMRETNVSTSARVTGIATIILGITALFEN